MANPLHSGHRLARAYQATPEHKLAAVLTANAIFKAIVLQKLADTTEELVRLSERVKAVAERGAR
jgi:hypothetical protein